MWHLIFPQNLSIEGGKDSISLLFMCKNIEGGILKEITISSSIKGRTNLSLNEQLNSYLKDKRSPTILVSLKLQQSGRKEAVLPRHTNFKFCLRKTAQCIYWLVSVHEFSLSVYVCVCPYPQMNKGNVRMGLWFLDGV